MALNIQEMCTDKYLDTSKIVEVNEVDHTDNITSSQEWELGCSAQDGTQKPLNVVLISHNWPDKKELPFTKGKKCLRK